MNLDATGEARMQDAPADDSKVTAAGDTPRRPLRRCIVTRGTGPKTGLLRCVVAPDGTLVPDATELLPGRGYWVTAARPVIETALKKRSFEKSAGGLPALVLIPALGTQRTFLVIAALLAVSSCFLLGARYLFVAAALAALVAIPPGAVKAEAGLLHEETSFHQYIRVVERPDGRRLLSLNEGVAVHSVWRPDSVLTGGVWDAFLAVPPLLGRPLERVTILGNAAGTTARALGVYYPEADVDGVELDPAVSRVGRRFFGMGENPRLTVHDADARPFLRSTDRRYDLIVVDAYHQPYVPGPGTRLFGSTTIPGQSRRQIGSL